MSNVVIPDEISQQVIAIAKEAAEIHGIDRTILENVAFRAAALALCTEQKG